jgi:tetratricopeptide (TPR) repeat protein
MGALPLAVLAALAGAAWVLWPAGEDGSYPDCPFEKVGADFPRIIPVGEVPDNAREQGRFLREQERAARFLKQEGAIRRATSREREAVVAALDQNYPKAEETARKVLKAHPDSVPARYALANALLHGEEDLPKALYHVRKARRLLEERGRQNPRDADSREWYIRVLDLEYTILSHLDRPAQQVCVAELLAQVYEDMPWLKVWPLAKLKRYDEARRCIEQTARTGRWKLRVLNDRTMVEAECQNRLGTYQAGKDMTQAVRDSAVLWSNFGESAFGAFRLKEAEEALRKSAALADAGRLDFNGSPHRNLSRIYLQQGRLKDAWEALQKGKLQRDVLREPYTMELDQGRMDRACALLLLALGQAEEALRFARRAHDRPDRTGQNSTDESRDALTNKLLLLTALQSRIEQLREADAAKTGLSGLTPNLERRGLEVEVWTIRKQLQKLLGGLSERNDFRPYLTGNATIEPWLMGGLVQVLPPAVATVAIRQARAADREHKEATPYYDAFEAEAALMRGQAAEALDLARKALAGLPEREEKLLRARTAAVAAEAARRLGQDKEYKNYLNQVLADSPQMVRLVPVVIPVRVSHDGTPLARRLADCLLNSPRFREDPEGFPVVIRTQGGQLRFEMSRLGGERHCQDGVSAKGDEDKVVADAVKAFHQKMMSPALVLTEEEVNSLDNSASGAKSQEDARRVLNPGRR